METIKQQDSGAAVEDVQHRLSLIGLLDEARVDGAFGPETAAAVKAFRAQAELPEGEEVDEKTWAALVDASYSLGDRTLYLRMPYFHGHDVLQLQQALSALGFACGPVDGMFGAFTELALRKFQTNLGLPTDGIAGAYTYSAIRNLHHSWEGKEAVRGSSHLGFARAAGVLERHALCLFGTQEFTRSVASRMSNLALATNPASKIMSADSLLVAPDEQMLLVHIVLPEEQTGTTPRVVFEPEDALPTRLESALRAARLSNPSRVAVELPGSTWEDAGVGRSAQHFAITLLDALCTALAKQEQ
ncbi:peptidoglycan-binding protein [Senegalimassilia faecalis]|uniref:peptidoglycan-binding domain-containing protein n=1 Tax=Senegalimassilia faecalis TaxID=2509433 RepID=UPI002586423E|nr:peptidoglycan-binding protein [uncultured Senegalimassilia sp.]